MKRLFIALISSVALFAFGLAGAPSAYAHSSGHMHSSSKMKHSCPSGEHWVKGYMRNGKKVHGYCRK